MSGYFDSLNRRAGRAAAVVPAPAAAGEATRAPTVGPFTVVATGGEAPAEYAALREKLLVAGNGKPLKTVVFAGCTGGEGCTQVVRRFAEALAVSGLNVLLVDADARAPRPAGHAATTGTDLSETVRTGAPLTATSWGAGRLTTVSSPASAPDKEHLFRDPKFAAWLDAQRSVYDYVLLDAPPLLHCADGTLMGQLSDGVVIVVEAQATEREALVRTRDQLKRAGAKVVGAVLNRARDPVPRVLRPYLSAD
jgi:Mrp family chromosome partitioning ATPase